MIVKAGENPQELQQWLHMFDTSLIQVTSDSPARVLQLCFKKLFRQEIKLAGSAAHESGQNTSGAINFE